jgi:hypothetical protein
MAFTVRIDFMHRCGLTLTDAVPDEPNAMSISKSLDHCSEPAEVTSTKN